MFNISNFSRNEHIMLANFSSMFFISLFVKYKNSLLQIFNTFFSKSLLFQSAFRIYLKYFFLKKRSLFKLFLTFNLRNPQKNLLRAVNLKYFLKANRNIKFYFYVNSFLKNSKKKQNNSPKTVKKYVSKTYLKNNFFFFFNFFRFYFFKRRKNFKKYSIKKKKKICLSFFLIKKHFFSFPFFKIKSLRLNATVKDNEKILDSNTVLFSKLLKPKNLFYFISRNLFFYKYLYLYYNYIFFKKVKLQPIFFQHYKLQHLLINFYKYLFEKFIRFFFKKTFIFVFKNLFTYVYTNKYISSIYYKLFLLPQAKHFSKFFYLLEMYNVLFIALQARNVNLILFYIATFFSIRHKHFFVLYQIIRNSFYDAFILFPNIVGIKLYIAGKFNGRLRSLSKQLVLKKNIPVQRLVHKINYAQQNVVTFTGIFGIHLWLYYF
jgi:hypothetical protein